LNPIKEAIIPLFEAQSAYGSYSGIATGNPAMPFLTDAMSTAAVREKLNGGLQTLQVSDWNMMIQQKQFGMLDVNFKWVLYAGGKIRAANSASQIQIEEEQALSQQKKDKIFTELVQRYYGLSLAHHATGVRAKVLSGVEEHLSDAEKLEAEGFIAKADVLHVKMYRAEAHREYQKALKTEGFLNVALQNTLTNDSIGNIQTISKLFIVDSLESVQYFKKLAQLNSPVLAQLDSKEKLTIQNSKVMHADLFPSIAAMGMYDVANIDLSPMMPEWMVGVGLIWTIFDGAAR
jgi:outer membrane protein TolC